ncbi:YALI0B01320p [Yarrowia lipolytica CLIB122]|uniref:YALI0B01320p n=2 Tax=Yarrowia lipolytica TaxID=4952 RepID=Q6CG31_YARLI|nr:YALI0B01320p [Yarrowia lipolytica CLIB122]7ZKP_C Chain C, assembly factor CIA84 [Yarrowia lipolytica]7ZKQ_C Chain C, complex I assembly factor CIA84 [Yarrowia lipolytica]AOW01071.1 hypothetical protein YALI1_B02228g [Yarrowia lipolytica]KAB8281035.1 hypothetical protein BKA91DRAFT_140839 [Yarrowia lipolytica]KAE8172918.1 hypothetical protein BKA90DRAFT_136538 [Yarrowia lipolytica]KAJ8051971.1 hypothetical protein LXG23DRAFT_38032 [Yarrowia lipolytica]RMJ00680.1 hypothetical protein BD777D|eukprot:XP_500381.1 YALI0B01320p [Yarrowia lipolytica CLIB122]
MPKNALLRSARQVAISRVFATSRASHVVSHAPILASVRPRSNPAPYRRNFSSSRALRNDYGLDTAERSLKESLVPFNGAPVDRKVVRDQLMELISVSPGQVFPISVIPVVKSAYYELFRENERVLSAGDTKTLFGAVAGNNPEDVQDLPFVLAVYHQAEQAAETNRDSRDNILLLGKYFLFQDRLDNFWKLLEAQIKTHDDVDAGFVKQLLELISVDPHLTLGNVARVLQLKTDNHVSSSDELRNALSATLEQLYYKENEGSEFFLSLVENHILDSKDFTPSDSVVAMILNTCVNEGREDLGQSVLRNVVSRVGNLSPGQEDPQNCWGFWSSVAMDLHGSKTDVKAFISRLEALPHRTKATWDILIRYAVFKADLAGRNDLLQVRALLAEMQKVGFEPDAETYFDAYRSSKSIKPDVVHLFEAELDIEKDTSIFAIEMDKALKNHDTLEALSIFYESFEQGAQWENKRLHMEAMTELLIQYAGLNDTSVADILQLVQRIEPICAQGRIPYSAETAIAQNVLQRHSDTANFYTFMNRQYGNTADKVTKQDPQIRPHTYQVIHDYIYSCESERADLAWEMYGLLHKFYVVPFADYYKAIKFFAQDVKRQDYALLTFQQIRKNHDLHGQPAATSEMVAFLFHEFAKTKYKRGIKRLHEVVALETSFDVNRDVLNEMMAAYVSVEDLNRVQDCWAQLQQLPPSIGANNRSVDVLLSYFKDNIHYTERTWQGIPEFGLLPTLENYEQYLINNCRTGNYRRALEITKNMEIDSGLKPTAKIIAAVYNYTFTEQRKLEVEQWAEKAHPEMWLELKEGDKLKSLCLPANSDNDNVESLLKQASADMDEEMSGGIVKVESV